MNFASFKSALGKAYDVAASSAATAAKDLQSQVGLSAVIITKYRNAFATVLTRLLRAKALKNVSTLSLYTRAAPHNLSSLHRLVSPINHLVFLDVCLDTCAFSNLPQG